MYSIKRTAAAICEKSSAVHSPSVSFPNGNENTVTIITSEGTSVHRIDPDRSKYPVLFAQPHPHRDVARLQLEYDRTPTWLFYAQEFLASNALAVVSTYPPDVPRISTHLLAVLGFKEPFHVLPVREKPDTLASHSEVLLVARRAQGIADLTFLEK